MNSKTTTPMTNGALNSLSEVYKLSRNFHNNIVLVNGKLDQNLTKISPIQHGIEIASSDYETTISIAQNTKVEEILNIISLMSSESHEGLCNSCINLNVLSGASVNILENHVSYFNGQYDGAFKFNIKLFENSNLVHLKTNLDTPFTKNDSKTNVEVLKNAQYQNTVVSLGSEESNHEISIDLIDDGAFGELNGLYALKHKQVVKFATSINHLKPHTHSSQLYKGILDDESKGIFSGKIFVNKDAQLITSAQLNRNLLLSKKAQIITTPTLEIHADDVKCSHGATTGNLNDEQLFYFESRGISIERAKKMLTSGFANDVFLKIKNPALVKIIQKNYFDYYERISS